VSGARGAKPESGNWVIPNELGNELGNNMRKARQLMAPPDKKVKKIGFTAREKQKAYGKEIKN